MSFNTRDQTYRLFQTRGYARSTVAPAHSSVLANSGKTPNFLVRHESTLVVCLASAKALFTRTKLPSSKSTKYLYRDASVAGFRAPRMGLANSLILHCSVIAALIYVPMVLPPKPPTMDSAFFSQEVIYYPVPEHHAAIELPRIAPHGTGGRSGSGFRPISAPAPGRTVSNGNLTAISKPLRPDNFHQTIIQPASPPDVRIKNDLKLPNISLGTTEPKKPTPSIDLRFKMPTKENTNIVAEMATPVTQTKDDFSSLTTLQPTNDQPKMPMPSGPLAKPMRREFGMDAGASEAPEISAPGDGRTVLVIGISPSEAASQLALPPGNRSGDFSIAPGNGTSGSPGGGRGGVAGGGNGGKNGAGDLSTGLGPGHEGGGGGNEGVLGAVSIKGTAAAGALDPRLVSNLVYPVPWALGVKLPKNRMIVSAGPMGGGGLSIYGALPCAKIFTIFLPMNDTNWTMQYCQKAGATAESPKTDPQATVIRLEAGLSPPDPDMDSRFDFKRLAVPAGKAHKMIVLRGTLREDGTVDDVEVYQGIVPQMDEAARVAFSRWKFKPAMRQGKPVALELLVGIPTEIAPKAESQ